jgi:outer membrane protein
MSMSLSRICILQFAFRSLPSLLMLSTAAIMAGCSPYGLVPSQEDFSLRSETRFKPAQILRPSPSEAPAGTLTVERAIEEALRASPELEQIRERINAADQQVKQAEAAFYPRLILGEDFNITTNPMFALMDIINQKRFQPDINFNDLGRQQNFSSQIKGEWSLFEGGSNWYEREAAMGQWRSMEGDLMAARNQLVSKVTQTYYKWLQALGFIGVAEKSLESATTNEQLGEARLKVETALPSEVMRLKARTAEARGNLVTARSNSRRLQAGLERLLARPIGPSEIPTPAPLPTSMAGMSTPEDSESLVRQALEKRPEIAAVRELIEASRNRVRSAQGSLLPRLGANANYAWDSEKFEGSSDSWFVGVQATWPLFEGGITLARIREARFRLREIEARGDQIALDIALEVHHAGLAVKEATEKIKVAEEREKWAKKALEEVRYQYESQVVTVDALLQAEVAWNQGEVAYTAALFEGRIAHALLRQALGDFAGWTEKAGP